MSVPRKVRSMVTAVATVIALSFGASPDLGVAVAQKKDCTPFGQWAIPSYIVMRESRGRNIPNSSGYPVSGFYQIMDSTWIGAGGHVIKSHGVPIRLQAMHHSKRAQDCLASRLWNGGRGSGHWAQTR